MIHHVPSTHFVESRWSGKRAPFWPYALCGCGTALYFHRPISSGLYEAEVWVTLLFLPIWPLATWVIRPKQMSTEHRNGVVAETYELDLLRTQPASAPGLFRMVSRALGRVSAALGPSLVSYLYAIQVDGGRPSQVKTWLVLGTGAWGIGLCLWWGQRRDRIYGGGPLAGPCGPLQGDSEP